MQNMRKSDSFQKAKNDSKKLTNEKHFSSMRPVPQPDATSLIADFLRKKHLTKTLETFEREYQTLNQNESLIGETLTVFDQGRSADFFTYYENFQKKQPSRLPTLEINKQEFYLHVYFVVHAIHPGLKNQKEVNKNALNLFKAYLEEKGAELAKFPDLIPFFALPYVKNLKEHASFKHLFTQTWVTTLRDSLAQELKSFGTLGSSSELENILCTHKIDKTGNSNRPNDEEQVKLKDTLRGKLRELEESRSSYKKLETESKSTMKAIHQKWASFVRWVY